MSLSQRKVNTAQRGSVKVDAAQVEPELREVGDILRVPVRESASYDEGGRKSAE